MTKRPLKSGTSFLVQWETQHLELPNY